MKKLVIFLLAITAFSIILHSLAEPETITFAYQGDVACFKSNGKVGLKSLDNTILSDAVFDYIGYFDQYGLAEIRIDGKIGRINNKGEIVIKPIECSYMGILEYMSVPRDGAFLFHPTTNQSLTGFYSRSGELITEAIWEETYGFKGMIAFVKQHGLWNAINLKGELLTDMWWDDCIVATDGSGTLQTKDRRIRLDSQGKVYYETNLNPDGQWKLTFLSTAPTKKFDFSCQAISPISSGYLYYNDGLWGILDEQENEVARPQWEFVTITKDSLLIRVEKNDKYGLIDQSGKMIVEIKCDGIDFVAPNRWLIRQNDARRIINDEGNVVKDLSSMNLKTAYSEKANYIRYSTISEQWGFMDADGNILSSVNESEIVPHVFGEYAEGFVPIELIQSGERGYMNVDGTILSSPDWVGTRVFSNGYAAVRIKSSNKWVHIDQQGNYVYTSRWDDCGEYFEAQAGFIATFLNKQEDGSSIRGFLNSKGEVICEYID